MGYLAAWLGSKSEYTQRKREPGRSHIAFYDLASDVIHPIHQDSHIIQPALMGVASFWKNS